MRVVGGLHHFALGACGFISPPCFIPRSYLLVYLALLSFPLIFALNLGPVHEQRGFPHEHFP
ncbi:BQ5605_C035g11373 [Microbotryum silenes-dioicae]|uniref:BQ5605_C035g11373 protein n=1 Tax=Microbotryum silenes-dioicae TaxID=796604 RepID=A0A2X0MJR0_9BASI|nr:BQ5605_C035g11373 [Microbotryum silenes-dioicae]